MLVRSEAEELLRPHYDRIRRCVESAWEGYQHYSPEHRLVHCSRTTACILNDHMRRQARIQFEDIPGTVLIGTRDYPHLVGIKSDSHVAAVLRFKKLTLRGESRNYPTEQALTFRGNQVPIPGIPPTATRLDVGYSLTLLKDRIARISASCYYGDKVAYEIEIAGGMGGEQLAFPDVPLPEPTGSRVVLRDEETAREKNGSSAES